LQINVQTFFVLTENRKTRTLDPCPLV